MSDYECFEFTKEEIYDRGDDLVEHFMELEIFTEYFLRRQLAEYPELKRYIDEYLDVITTYIDNLRIREWVADSEH